MNTLREALTRTRSRATVDALRATNGNVPAAARLLGVQRSWVYVIIRGSAAAQRIIAQARRRKRRRRKE